MTDQRRIPPVPLWLGLAGLIPFWALAIGLCLHLPAMIQPARVATGLATYGAIILSFLGGIRWGLAVAKNDGDGDYVVSIMPSLVAWALVMAPDPWRLAGLGVAALVLGPIDLKMSRAGAAPPWFGRLRIILSSGAGVALLLAAVAAA